MARSLSNPTVAHQPKPVVKEKDRDPVAAGKRDAAFNRSASFNYFLSDKFEAGVALRGTEVKSIREGKANLKDAYGLLKDGECFLLNAHIGPFSHGNAMNHDSLRTRKLLLHKNEVRKLEGMTKQKGFTLIPTRLYFRNGRVKCELALAKGKQEWDKRATERKREADKRGQSRGGSESAAVSTFMSWCGSFPFLAYAMISSNFGTTSIGGGEVALR